MGKKRQRHKAAKATKASRWEARQSEWFEPLYDASGVMAFELDHSSRHCRIAIPKLAVFDFWPSTGRWLEIAPGRKKGVNPASLIEQIYCLAKKKPRQAET